MKTPSLPDERLPALRKLAWGVGGAAENFMANGLPTLVMPIYNIALGIAPEVIGWVMAIPRIVDAVFDIWIGHVSDNSTSRWGKRRPFIFWGAVLSALFSAVLWLPPVSLGSGVITAYLLAMSMAYFLSYGLFCIPYNALGYDLSPDYHDRTSVQTWRFVFVMVSAFAISWLYKLCFVEWFSGPAPWPLGRQEVAGIRTVGWLVAGVVLVAGIVPAIFSQERQSVRAAEQTPLLKAFAQTMSDRVFLHFILTIITSIFGLMIVGPLALYVMIYHVFDGAKEVAAMWTGFAGLASGIAGLAASLFVPPITRRIGKRGGLLLGQALVVTAGVSSWWLFTPAHPWLLLIPNGFFAIGMCFFQVLYGSYIGDICDLDEERCGQRREGMYGAVATFLNKVVAALVTTLSGYLILWTGFHADLAVQGSDTVLTLRIFFCAAPASFALVAMILAATLPVSAEKVLLARRELEKRRNDGKIVSQRIL